MSQKKLALLCGLSKTTIANMEKGEPKESENIDKVGKVLGIDLDHSAIIGEFRTEARFSGGGKHEKSTEEQKSLFMRAIQLGIAFLGNTEEVIVIIKSIHATLEMDTDDLKRAITAFYFGEVPEVEEIEFWRTEELLHHLETVISNATPEENDAIDLRLTEQTVVMTKAPAEANLPAYRRKWRRIARLARLEDACKIGSLLFIVCGWVFAIKKWPYALDILSIGIVLLAVWGGAHYLQKRLERKVLAPTLQATARLPSPVLGGDIEALLRRG